MPWASAVGGWRQGDLVWPGRRPRSAALSRPPTSSMGPSEPQPKTVHPGRRDGRPTMHAYASLHSHPPQPRCQSVGRASRRDGHRVSPQLGKLVFLGGGCWADLRRTGVGTLVALRVGPRCSPWLPAGSGTRMARALDLVCPFAERCRECLILSRRQSATAAGAPTDHAACASPHPHRPEPRCHVVDQSKLRQRKRGGETLGDDLFVPKQLGWGRWLGLGPLSSWLMVRRRPRLFAVVRGRCHAVRHAPRVASQAREVPAQVLECCPCE